MFRTILCISIILFVVYAGKYENNEDDEVSRVSQYLADVAKTLRLDRLYKIVQVYVETSVYAGETYSYEMFQLDWQSLPMEPVKIFQLIHRAAWSLAVHTVKEIVRLLHRVHENSLSYLRKRCDVLLGKHDPYHPWNILARSEKEVSFVVYIYGALFTILLFKLLDGWNFVLYLAASFLVHSFHGPKSLFQWYLVATGVILFVFDLVIRNPLPSAIVFVAVYFSGYIIPWITPA